MAKRGEKKLDSFLTIVPLVEELREELKMTKEENKSLRTALKWANDEIEALKQNQANAAILLQFCLIPNLRLQ